MIGCEYCTSDRPAGDAPALEDDAAWDAMADVHDEKCDWLVTRNFRAHVELEDREWFLVADNPDSQFIRKLPMVRR